MYPSTDDSTIIRPFARADRDQLTQLVNAHLAAVVPGMTISVQALLASLEREPGEFIVDRWVSERRTLVADQRDRIVGAAHLLRYADGPDVGASYRDTGEIRWLLFHRDAPYWPGGEAAGLQLAQAALAQLARWGVRTVHADGTLPRPGVYGVSDAWAHVRQVYERVGFGGGSTETVWIARVGDLRAAGPDGPGLAVVRSMGVNGTRFTAVEEGAPVGYIEVEVLGDAAVQLTAASRWADVGNLHVDPEHRRRGIARHLLREAADWLDLAGVPRLLAYTSPEEEAEADEVAFLTAAGFRVLTRTRRGLTLG